MFWMEGNMKAHHQPLIKATASKIRENPTSGQPPEQNNLVWICTSAVKATVKAHHQPVIKTTPSRLLGSKKPQHQGSHLPKTT